MVPVMSSELMRTDIQFSGVSKKSNSTVTILIEGLSSSGNPCFVPEFGGESPGSGFLAVPQMILRLSELTICRAVVSVLRSV